MLHLLPIRLLMRMLAAFAALIVLSADYAGSVGNGDTVADVARIFRWSSTIAISFATVFYAAWRWVTPLQYAIFPYLGGRWCGKVVFQTPSGSDHREVTLEVKHTPLSILLLLDSAESRSSTLAVHAERDTHFERFRLYYVYLNERKEGVAGGGQQYRGIAIIRFERGVPARLEGDYFTETGRRGTLHLTQEAATSWWKIWR